MTEKFPHRIIESRYEHVDERKRRVASFWYNPNDVITSKEIEAVAPELPNSGNESGFG